MSRFLKIFLFVLPYVLMNIQDVSARVCFLPNARDCEGQTDQFNPAGACPKDMTGAVHEEEKKEFLAYRAVCEDENGRIWYMPIGCRDGYINIKGANVSCSKVESFGQWNCCLRSNISCGGFVCPAGSIQEGEPCMEYDISGKVTAVKYENCRCPEAYKYSSCNKGSVPMEGSCTTLTGDVLYKGCRCDIASGYIETDTAGVPSSKIGCTIEHFPLVGKDGRSCYKEDCSCEEKCEPLIQAPSHGKLVETVCRACDEVYTDYFDFECDEGYKKKDKTCIVATCPQGYSTDYATREMCGEGWDWIYDQSGQSGEIACGSCKCQSGCTAVSSDKNNEELGNKCCNGKYQSCTSKCGSEYNLASKNASGAKSYETCDACGTKKYKIKTCQDIYELNENGTQCVCKEACLAGYSTTEQTCEVGYLHEVNGCSGKCYRCKRCMEDGFKICPTGQVGYGQECVENDVTYYELCGTLALCRKGDYTNATNGGKCVIVDRKDSESKLRNGYYEVEECQSNEGYDTLVKMAKCNSTEMNCAGGYSPVLGLEENCLNDDDKGLKKPISCGGKKYYKCECSNKYNPYQYDSLCKINKIIGNENIGQATSDSPYDYKLYKLVGIKKGCEKYDKQYGFYAMCSTNVYCSPSRLKAGEQAEDYILPDYFYEGYVLPSTHNDKCDGTNEVGDESQGYVWCGGTQYFKACKEEQPEGCNDRDDHEKQFKYYGIYGLCVVKEYKEGGYSGYIFVDYKDECVKDGSSKYAYYASLSYEVNGCNGERLVPDGYSRCYGVCKAGTEAAQNEKYCKEEDCCEERSGCNVRNDDNIPTGYYKVNIGEPGCTYYASCTSKTMDCAGNLSPVINWVTDKDFCKNNNYPYFISKTCGGKKYYNCILECSYTQTREDCEAEGKEFSAKCDDGTNQFGECVNEE